MVRSSPITGRPAEVWKFSSRRIRRYLLPNPTSWMSIRVFVVSLQKTISPENDRQFDCYFSPVAETAALRPVSEVKL